MNAENPLKTMNLFRVTGLLDDPDATWDDLGYTKFSPNADEDEVFGALCDLAPCRLTNDDRDDLHVSWNDDGSPASAYISRLASFCFEAVS